MTSLTEENYLKAIYHLSIEGRAVSTNELAENIQIKAASVTDMVKKLSEKNFINYIKYQGVTLTDLGQEIALKVIRKHRLWEVFLVEKLKFGWDEIHEIAEQLEHIESTDLTDRLDDFLGNPSFDPHGDPIPNKKGKLPILKTMQLSEAPQNIELILMGVSEDSSSFLKHLDNLKLSLGAKIKILSLSSFDNSIQLLINKEKELFLSYEVSKNLSVVLA